MFFGGRPGELRLGHSERTHEALNTGSDVEPRRGVRARRKELLDEIRHWRMIWGVVIRRTDDAGRLSCHLGNNRGWVDVRSVELTCGSSGAWGGTGVVRAGLDRNVWLWYYDEEMEPSVGACETSTFEEDELLFPETPADQRVSGLIACRHTDDRKLSIWEENSPIRRYRPTSEVSPASQSSIDATSVAVASLRSLDEAITSVRLRFPFEGYVKVASGAYQDVAETVLKWLRPPAKILDFGSGPCDKTALLAALGYDCSACDDLGDEWHRLGNNREKILEFARASRVRFVLTDEDSPLPFFKGEFDALMMNDVLEHLHDSPKDLMLSLLDLVRPGGMLFVTVPNAVNLLKRAKVLFGRTNLPSFEGFYWYPNSWRGHVREYTKGDLEQLCDFLDLEVLELHGVHHMLHAIPGPLKPMWIALTGLVRGGRDSWSLVARKNPDWSPRALSRDGIYSRLGRFEGYQH